MERGWKRSLTAEPAASSVGETADSINIAEVLG